MKKILLSISLFLLCINCLFSQTIAPFKDGDRVVFLGNSITDGGHYHSYIWLYYMTRFPYMDIRVMNAGIGGEIVGDMYNRLDGDVFSKCPTVLTVTFGMNDTGYAEYNGEDPVGYGEKRYQECYDNYLPLEKRLKGAKDVRVVMLGTSPYDETSKIKTVVYKNKNQAIKRVIEMQKKSALANGWEFLDFNEPMSEVSIIQQVKDSTFTMTMGDRVHPDNAGHMFMAYLFLKAQGMAGKPISIINIDGSKAKVISTENCHISNVKRSHREISFDYLAEALPYPLDSIMRASDKGNSQAVCKQWVPFVEEMNREILSVKGLKGDYDVWIDDEIIGRWNASELSEGINMAEITNTPQYRQAQQIMYLNECRWNIEREFRDYAWMQYGFFRPRGLLNANNTEALKTLKRDKVNNLWAAFHTDTYARLMLEGVRETRMMEQELLIQRMYELNKPITRKITLKSVQP